MRGYEVPEGELYDIAIDTKTRESAKYPVFTLAYSVCTTSTSCLETNTDHKQRRAVQSGVVSLIVVIVVVIVDWK